MQGDVHELLSLSEESGGEEEEEDDDPESPDENGHTYTTSRPPSPGTQIKRGYGSRLMNDSYSKRKK